MAYANLGILRKARVVFLDRLVTHYNNWFLMFLLDIAES